MSYEIICGDCREVMAEMAPDSIDAIVCDPPYGLEFMGKGWDRGVPGVEFWTEALRVLKPGGHLLAFGGTRTFHRLTVAIEDAGFEVRDCLSWMYGQGFPKSMDVSKAIDKAVGAKRESLDKTVGAGSSNTESLGVYNHEYDITAPATPEAEQWQGWGTALKPAWEPIILARKPLIGTVAANVLERGTGAINIDGTRIFTTDDLNGGAYSGDLRRRDEYSSTDTTDGAVALSRLNRGSGEYVQPSGRWPANVILTHHEDCVEVGTKTVASNGHLPKARSGSTKITTTGHAGQDDLEERHTRGETVLVFDCHPDCSVRLLDEQTGTLTSGKVKFFYCAKVAKRERNAGMPEGQRNDHPTVKPVAVMAWLCRLVTPPNGVVLDPFAGSGSTGIAAIQEGFKFVGIDNNEHYCDIARHRLAHAAESAT